MKIYFDMDGTIADLYGVENWLSYLMNANTTPYEIAKPMMTETKLAELAKTYELGIISWTCKGGTAEYNKAVRKAKVEWLAKNFPNIHFTEIHIVKYGTPKWKVAKERNAFLIDDEEPNRKEWKGVAYHPNEI